MMAEYEISIDMTPDCEYAPSCPYQWHIFKWENGEYWSCGYGWCKTPEDAWKEAYKCYNEFHRSKQQTNDQTRPNTKTA